MQGKNIRYHLSKKIQDWANSVDDSEIKDLILTENSPRKPLALAMG